MLSSDSSFLYGQDYHKFVDGEYSYSKDESDKSVWFWADRTLVSLIIAPLLVSTLATIIGSSAEIRLLIQENYYQKSIANIFFYKKRLTNLDCGFRSVTGYLQEAMSVLMHLWLLVSYLQQITSNLCAQRFWTGFWHSRNFHWGQRLTITNSTLHALLLNYEAWCKTTSPPVS